MSSLNFSKRVKLSKRFCPTCFTQEVVSLSGDEVVCSWCDSIFRLDELVQSFEIRDKKIDEVLS